MFALVAIGIAAGMTAAAFVAQYLRVMLFGVSPSDPTTFVAAAILLPFLALMAAYVPARRAASVDPLLALRHD
jgi:hypothetical protein